MNGTSTNRPISNDPAHDPTPGPQFPLGASSSEASIHAQLVRNPLPTQGGIVDKIGQQFQLPAASPSTGMSNRPGTNVGEIG